MPDIQLPFELRRVQAGSEVARVRSLFQEYQHGLGVDLEFQGFSAELGDLPGAYAPPRGRLYLAMMTREAAGCVGLRPLSDAQCEIKRLYVRPTFRRRGIGRLLARRVIGDARALGYTKIVLDTLANMTEAHALYAELGFTETAPYTPNPFDGARFLGLDLATEPQARRPADA